MNVFKSERHTSFYNKVMYVFVVIFDNFYKNKLNIYYICDLM